jgi:uncharacterized protein YbaR (Trm112 family)
LTRGCWKSLPAPFAREPLLYQSAAQALVCRADRLAFPIRDGVPVMETEARVLNSDDPLLER